MIRFGDVFFTVCLVLIAPFSFAQGLSDQIRINLEKATQEKPHVLGGVFLKNVGEVYQFYAQRGFEPVWSREFVLTERAYEMRYEIRQSQFDGLKPEDYHLGVLEASFAQAEQKKKDGGVLSILELTQLEIVLTDAFFELADDLAIGKVNPSSLKASWNIPRRSRSIDPSTLLIESLAQEDLRAGLAKLYPKTLLYAEGKQLMRELDEKQKKEPVNWKSIKTDRAFKVGDFNPVISQVRERLAYWGFVPSRVLEDPKKYDSLLLDRVLDFQKSKGMTADGVLGTLTLEALNDSPSELVDKIALNLERLRWIPDEFFEGEAIFVNIPSFQLIYRSGADTLFSTKVIVGTVKHQSPVFTAPMSYLVMSPYWNIPPSIARNETIPAIKRNPSYLESNRMEVVNSAGNSVPPSAVNWNARPFPYLIRQKPGEDNALGLVKFMFPNPNNVYLHDTPAKQLFDREIRTFSHGCIRMQNPKTFADLLLKNKPGWTSDRIWEAMNQSKEQIVQLDKKIPVVITYLTLTMDAKGNPQFRQDVYQRDAEVLSLLKR
ncbi:murein L,D-transpeptidase [Algoriphagus aquatilis]|uniref:Murein L,D-transpeptidase n=1 Tax=Algoriphagus aquatilis TaxID=490186 RepID=A0ABW0BZN3_9BACT